MRLSLEAVTVMALLWMAVDFRKQRRIMRAASWFLNEYGLNDVQCSFDVMTVENNEARYILIVMEEYNGIYSVK